MSENIKIINSAFTPDKELLAIRIEDVNGCQYEGILKKRTVFDPLMVIK